MTNDRISVDTTELARYATRNGTLSADIAGAAGSHLGNLSIPADVFGDLGKETGLHATLGEHLDRMHTHVHSIAGSVRDLGDAVHTARGDYEADEALHAQRLRGLMP